MTMRTFLALSCLVLTYSAVSAATVDAGSGSTVTWFDVGAFVVHGPAPAHGAGTCIRQALPAALDGAAFAAAFGGSEVRSLGRTRVDLGEPRTEVAPRLHALLRASDTLVFAALGGRVAPAAGASGEVALRLQLLGAQFPIMTDGVTIDAGARFAFAAPMPSGDACLVVTVIPRTVNDASPPDDAWQLAEPGSIRAWSRPDRPDTTRGRKHHGAVKVGVKVQPDGKPGFVRAVEYPKGAEDLALFAMTSVMRWTFDPEPRSTLVVVRFGTVEDYPPTGGTVIKKQPIEAAPKDPG